MFPDRCAGQRVQSWAEHCAVILRPGSIWSRRPTTNPVLQGEHFNKQLRVNFHQADTDTLLTHTEFHLHSINCYKYITDKQLNPRPWGPSPLMYLHTVKGWEPKIHPLKWMALINSERTKPRHYASTSDWQITVFPQRIPFKIWILKILKNIESKKSPTNQSKQPKAQN